MTNILNSDSFFVISFRGTPKDDDFPFPWKKSSQRDASGSAPSETTSGSRKRSLDTMNLPVVRSQGVHLWTQRFADYVKQFPELQDLQNKLNEQFPGQIQFRLPRLGALAGNVVHHATNVLEEVFLVQSPCTFKIGFTHCPLWRWGNKVYGYAASKDKWSTMFILYLTAEPYSPSMLEAALIDKYKRPSLELYMQFSVFVFLTRNNNICAFCCFTIPTPIYLFHPTASDEQPRHQGVQERKKRWRNMPVEC